MSISERTELLFGKDAVSRFESSSIMVIGIGGVGSNCTLSLARSGVGRLVLVDYDTVSESNINRQAIAFESTVGLKKTSVAKKLISEINPEAKVLEICKKVLPDDIDWLFEQAGSLDYVIDCADTITSKVAVAKKCQDIGVGYIAAMGSGNKFDPELIEFSDIFDTKVCPVCKAVRKAARKADLDSMQVVYSPEEPINMTASSEFERLERRNIGTVAYYPAIMGHMAASFALRKIANML